VCRPHRAGLGLFLLAASCAAGCVSSARLSPQTPDRSACAARTDAVRWLRVAPPDEAAAIDRWCGAVGAPVVNPRPATETSRGITTVVSWNTHVGSGDVERLVGDLKSGRLTGGQPGESFVLLLQEVYRAGPALPSPPPVGADWARRQQPRRPDGSRIDILETARRLGLALAYAPSMRNGNSTISEDRGNAILSTRPLSDVTAIELPQESQRRVAITATIDGVRFVSSHFTNVVGHHLYLFSEPARVRQARALAEVIARDGAVIVGGDMNTWFGFRDAAYRELARHMSPPAPLDRRATFGPMRLDHLLFRLPPGSAVQVRRAEDRYGSDHYPLIASIAVR
jgi:endonuclease/exonuclease/phosphatase family metal-dependent hydrolase